MEKTIIELTRNLLKEESIVIMPPKLGSEDKPDTHLRVYANGGYIGGIPTASDGQFIIVSKNSEYFRNETYHKSKNEDNKHHYPFQDDRTKEFKKKCFSEGSNYIEYMINATNIKFSNPSDVPESSPEEDNDKQSSNSPKERKVETKLAKQYCLFDKDRNDWAIIDMEFFVPQNWSPLVTTSGEKKFIGKPDLIIYDSRNNSIGIIELKVDYKGCENTAKHIRDMAIMHNKKNQSKIIDEIARRVKCLKETECMENTLFDNFDKDTLTIWLGFLFVNSEIKSSDECKKVLQSYKIIDNNKYKAEEFTINRKTAKEVLDDLPEEHKKDFYFQICTKESNGSIPFDIDEMRKQKLCDFLNGNQ